MAEYKNVLVHCEAADGKLTSMATELLGVGSRLARELDEQLCALLTGTGIAPKEAIAFGADKVYVLDEKPPDEATTDYFLTAFDGVIEQLMPRVMLFGQTPAGRDIAPRIAFRRNTAAVLDCVSLEIDKESKRLLQTKPVSGGNALAVFSDPQIATVRPKAMAPLAKDDQRKGEVHTIHVDINAAGTGTMLLERAVVPSEGIKLEEARVIVSGGRGIGDAEGFKQLEELARLLHGAVGASRPPCDNGWVPNSYLIGLTGKVVSPDVYIAVAISGASQHLSGCSGSKTIVAFNKDSEANIFRMAQFGIVGDWKRIIPAFASRVKALKNE